MNRIPFTLPDVGLREIKGMVYVDEGYLVLRVENALLGVLDAEKDLVKIEPQALEALQIKPRSLAEAGVSGRRHASEWIMTEMERTTKKSLYAPETYEECVARIEQLSPGTPPQWGSMTVAQMLAHCAEVLEVANGKPLTNTPLLAKLFRGLIRNMVVGERPYPKGVRTHPQYRQTAERDFGAEKQRLLQALAQFFSEDKTQSAQREHPLFGKMSAEEKGWSMYKHLDHHLTQFGV